jgi:hypothetical protein
LRRAGRSRAEGWETEINCSRGFSELKLHSENWSVRGEGEGREKEGRREGEGRKEEDLECIGIDLEEGWAVEGGGLGNGNKLFRGFPELKLNSEDC